MQFQFDIASTSTKPPVVPQPLPESVPDLLRALYDMQRDQLNQILEVQKEHLHHARSSSHENVARWRNLLSRWQKDYPDFAGHCQQAYPLLERSYVQLLVGMVEEVAGLGDDALDSEFAVQEFLDRYGMKIGQLSHLMSIVGPLAEAAHQQEEANKQAQQQQP